MKKKKCCKGYGCWKVGLIGLIFVWLSWFCRLTIYPCKSSPVIAVPKYTWKFCTPNILGKLQWVGVHEMYFGFNAGKWIALVLNLVIAWLIVCLLVYLYKKFKK